MKQPTLEGVKGRVLVMVHVHIWPKYKKSTILQGERDNEIVLFPFSCLLSLWYRLSQYRYDQSVHWMKTILVS